MHLLSLELRAALLKRQDKRTAPTSGDIGGGPVLGESVIVQSERIGAGAAHRGTDRSGSARKVAGVAALSLPP
jgi:hypothetical protein